MGTLAIGNSNNWKELSVFISQVNDWFDVCNSRVPRIDSRPRMAVYGLELGVQNEILDRMASGTRNMRVGERRTLLPFRKGINKINKA